MNNILVFRLVGIVWRYCMPKSGSQTKQKILSVAKELALKQGHVSTSIDEIIEKTGITKGSFFYHFPSKQQLSNALIEEFSSAEIVLLRETLNTCKKLSKDPLQQLLIFVGLIQEAHTELDERLIGCLFASYSYQNQLEDENIKTMVHETLDEWKKELENLIREVMQKHIIKKEVDPSELAEMFLVTLEGAYVMSRIKHNPEIIQSHLEQYKNYIEALFT